MTNEVDYSGEPNITPEMRSNGVEDIWKRAVVAPQRKSLSPENIQNPGGNFDEFGEQSSPIKPSNCSMSTMGQGVISKSVEEQFPFPSPSKMDEYPEDQEFSTPLQPDQFPSQNRGQVDTPNDSPYLPSHSPSVESVNSSHSSEYDLADQSAAFTPEMDGSPEDQKFSIPLQPGQFPSQNRGQVGTPNDSPYLPPHSPSPDNFNN
jgi:hypothetical protein